MAVPFLSKKDFPTFLSDKVKGDAVGYVPNGCVQGNNIGEGEPTGAIPAMFTYNKPEDWKGNRSGE